MVELIVVRLALAAARLVEVALVIVELDEVRLDVEAFNRAALVADKLVEVEFD